MNSKLDFYPLAETNQSLLIKLRTWTKAECIDFLKSNVFPNIANEQEIPSLVEQMEQQSLVEIKTSLIQIFQNVSASKLFKASNFN